jgi:ABC-2 type transport system ATP-binding protein
MVAAFGTVLHVTAVDARMIEVSIAPFRDNPRWHWTPAKPSLEDVFIHTLARLGAIGNER